MTAYDKGRNDGLLIGLLQKGVIIKERDGPKEGFKEIGGSEYEVIGAAKVLNYVKENLE